MVKVVKDTSVILLAVVFVVIVCGGLTLANIVSGSNSSTLAYNIMDSNKTVTIKPGETFKVVLDENPTTGYNWTINVTPGLSIVSDTYIPPQGGLMGAGGQHEWQVKATGAGDQQLTGVYKRSWEPTFGNETTYSLSIKIE